MKWRFDGKSGHPVYNHRYAFQDKLNAPFHVVHSRADNRGRVSKSYLLTDNIETLLSERVSEPELPTGRHRHDSKKHPIRTNPELISNATAIKAPNKNRKSPQSGVKHPLNQHHVKAPRNSTQNGKQPNRSKLPPLNASGTTIASSVNSNQHLSTSTPNKNNSQSHTKPITSPDIQEQKPNPLHTANVERSNSSLSTTIMPYQAVYRTTKSTDPTSYSVEKEQKTEQATKPTQISTATTRTTTPRPEQHSSRATSQSFATDDDSEDFEVEVEDLSDSDSTPQDPPIDPIIYEGIIGAVQSNFFPIYQPELDVDPTSGEPAFAHRYAFRDDVNPSYFVYDTNTKTHSPGNYFKPGKYGQDKSNSHTNSHSANNKSNRPHIKYHFNRPRPNKHNASQVAQLPPPTVIASRPLGQPQPNVSLGRPNATDNQYNPPAVIDPNVYQGIIGAAQYGFPMAQPAFLPAQVFPGQQQYGVWTFQGFGYQTPVQAAFQQNFYFPSPIMTPITGGNPVSQTIGPPSSGSYYSPSTAVPTVTPIESTYPIASSTYNSAVYTERPNYFITSSKATPQPTVYSTPHHSKPTNTNRPSSVVASSKPPATSTNTPSRPTPQYPVSSYQTTHYPDPTRPSYISSTPQVITSTTRPPATQTVVTERPNYFVTSAKPPLSSVGQNYNRPSYAGNFPSRPTYATTPITTPPTITIGTTTRPNYFGTSSAPSFAPPTAAPPYPSVPGIPPVSSNPSEPIIYNPIHIGGSPPGNQITIAYGPNVFNHHPTAVSAAPAVYTSTTTTTTTTQNSVYTPQSSNYPYSRDATNSFDIRMFDGSTKGNAH